MGKNQKTPVHRQPPLGGSHDLHAGYGVVTGRSSDLQAGPIGMIGVSTGPSSRFQRKPVVFGCSILLTAAGQSRIPTGFPLTFPWERHQQAKHKIECCLGTVNLNVGARLPHHFRGLGVDRTERKPSKLNLLRTGVECCDFVED